MTISSSIAKICEVSVIESPTLLAVLAVALEAADSGTIALLVEELRHPFFAAALRIDMHRLVVFGEQVFRRLVPGHLGRIFECDLGLAQRRRTLVHQGLGHVDRAL